MKVTIPKYILVCSGDGAKELITVPKCGCELLVGFSSLDKWKQFCKRCWSQAEGKWDYDLLDRSHLESRFCTDAVVLLAVDMTSVEDATFDAAPIAEVLRVWSDASIPRTEVELELERYPRDTKD